MSSRGMGLRANGTWKYYALFLCAEGAGHTLSASVGTLEPSLVSDLDLEDVQVSVSDSS